MRENLKLITQKIAYRVGVEPGNFMGVCLAILSGFMLMINGAIGKYLGEEIHPFLITFFRSAIIVAISAISVAICSNLEPFVDISRSNAFPETSKRYRKDCNN